MRKHTTHWQPTLIGIMFLLICTITTNIASAATVHLEMTDKNNAPLTSGSGFFVSDTLIVTNADAIKDAVTGTAQVVGKDKKHAIEGVAAVDPKNEIVLLRVLPSGAAPLPLGDSDTIKIGDTVVIPSNALAALVKQTEQSEQAHNPIGNISAEYFNRSGLAQAKLGNYHEAISDYSVAIKLKTDYVEAYSNRGLAKHHLKQYGHALWDYDMAINQNPDYAAVYYNRARTKQTLKKHKEAIPDYDAAIKIDPEYVEAYFYRGDAKRNMRRYFAAIPDYDTVIKLKPDYAEAYYRRGNAKQSMGKYEDAIPDYDVVIRMQPKYADVYQSRGNANLKLEQYEAAVLDFEIVIGLKPDYAKAYFDRGKAKYHLGQFEDAVADIDVAIRLNSNDLTNYYYYRGSAKYELGQYAEALADLDKSNVMHPFNPETLHNLGKTRAALGEYKAAIKDYNMALQFVPPNYEEIFYSRGDAYVGLGEKDIAFLNYAMGSVFRGIKNRDAGNIVKAKENFNNALQLAEQIGNKVLKTNIEKELRQLSAK